MRPPLASALVLLMMTTAVRAQDAPIRIGEVAVRDGPGSAVAMGRAVRSSIGRLRACHDRAGPRVAGRIELALAVTPEGEVSAEVAHRSFEPSPEMESCLLRVLRGARFPALGAPSHFSLALALAASPRAPAEAPPAAASTEADTMRAEIARARGQARCLARAASQLERLLAEWEHATPRGRERLTARIGDARIASALCRPDVVLSTLAAVTSPTPSTDPACPGCRV